MDFQELYHLFTDEERGEYTELVGNGFGDTLGIIIPNIDPAIHQILGISPNIRSLGILGSRIGAGPQAIAADEAMKGSNVELIRMFLARDGEGGAGHGITVILGAEDVSDVRRAVESMLKAFDWAWGDLYTNQAGHVEVDFTARAGKFLAEALGAEEGRAWGLICGAPVSVGLLMADRALKAAHVEVIDLATPDHMTRHCNETMLFIKGDSGAVRQSLIAARDAGKKALEALGGPLSCPGHGSYIDY